MAITELEKGKKWWKSAQDYRTAQGQVLAAGWMIDAELYAGGLGEGKGWKKLKEEVRTGRSEIEAIDMAEAAMTFHEPAKVNTGYLSRIESQLEKLTEQVSLVACLNGAGSMEDQAQAKSQAAQKKTEAEKRLRRMQRRLNKSRKLNLIRGYRRRRLRRNKRRKKRHKSWQLRQRSYGSGDWPPGKVSTTQLRS